MTLSASLSASQPNIDWTVRAFDDEDLIISKQFRSGCLGYGDILAHPKYNREGILGALLLPHSLIQFGMGWFRSIPMGYLGQDPSLEVGTESLTPSLVDDFSLKLLSSIFIATADSPQYTASGGLSDLFKSNMFKDAAPISSISTKNTKAIQDFMASKANADMLPRRKLSSSLSPLSHVSPVSSPQVLNSLGSPKKETKPFNATSNANPALDATSIKTKVEVSQQESFQQTNLVGEKLPPSMPEPVVISGEVILPSDLKRNSPDSSSTSPRKLQRLASPSLVSPSIPKSPEATTLASSSIPTTQVTENNTTITDGHKTEVDSNCDSPKESTKSVSEAFQNDKSPEKTNGSNGNIEVNTSLPETSINLKSEEKEKEKEKNPEKSSPVSSLDPVNKISSLQIEENANVSPSGSESLAKSSDKLGNGEKENNFSTTGSESLSKSIDKEENEEKEKSLISTDLDLLNNGSNKLETEEKNKSPLNTELPPVNKSPSPKPTSPSKSNLSLLSRSSSPTSEKAVAPSEDLRESWQDIERTGYPAQPLPSFVEELQDSYWTKFYRPTEAFPMKMFIKYTIHFFSSARTEAGPLPPEIDLEGTPGIVADNMIGLVRRIYDQAGSSMSHELKATVNQALCVIGRYLSNKSASVVDDFITRNYQPVNKKVSSADRIAVVARFVSRVWDKRSPISRMSNLHVNFYKLAGLLGEQGTNSIVSALLHLQEKYPPTYD